MRWRLLALTMLAGVWGCSSCAGGATGEPIATGAPHLKDSIKLEPSSPHMQYIKTQTVEESDAATAVSLTAKIAFDEDHTQRLASPIDGRVTALLAKPGDKVRSGQALVELSSPNVGVLQADAQKALQDLTVQTKALERVHKLQADGAISEKDVAQVEADFRKAKSDVARTTAQLHSLGIS